MHKRSSMYGMVSLAIILFGTVFMNQIAGEKQRALMKGYLFSFSDSHGCGGIPALRMYKRYYFTAGKLHNDSTMQALKQYLDVIGRSYDSLHGADIRFADNVSYEYYLKTVAICHEYPPKEIVPFENHMHVHGRSKYELWEDSINTASLKQFGTPELDMNYP